jgi:hypothetical protein
MWKNAAQPRVGVVGIFGSYQGSSDGSEQPWAGGRNPVGIRRKRESSCEDNRDAVEIVPTNIRAEGGSEQSPRMS